MNVTEINDGILYITGLIDDHKELISAIEKQKITKRLLI